MAYVAVTVEYKDKTRDLALPMHISSRLVIDGLIPVMRLPQMHGQKYYFGMRTDTGMRSISPNANLGDAGILHGMALTLLEQKEAEAPPKTGAFLRAETGSTYPLTTGKTVIGRNDPKSGIFVEIDLSLLASDPKAISRRHAQIEQEGDHFTLQDLASTNGTKLNGQRLPPRERKPLWDGDVIEFGRHAATLSFCSGGEKGPQAGTPQGGAVRPPAQEPRAFLKSESGTTFPLGAGRMVIGRSDAKSGTVVEVDLTPLVARPQAISRRHAQIEQEGGLFFLSDLGSSNGTKLNGQPLQPGERKPLKEGDLIEFGRNAARLRFGTGEEK